jgi:hypothetical protein
MDLAAIHHRKPGVVCRSLASPSQRLTGRSPIVITPVLKSLRFWFSGKNRRRILGYKNNCGTGVTTKMPCTEIKELEAGFERFGERRQRVCPTTTERRKDLGLGRRASYARQAFLVQMHRQNCRICKTSVAPSFEF